MAKLIVTTSRVIKCDSHPPRTPVRLCALHNGKRLYMPVPEFSTGGLPWALLDPHRLEPEGTQFEMAATSAGAILVGQPVRFEDVERADQPRGMRLRRDHGAARGGVAAADDRAVRFRKGLLAEPKQTQSAALRFAIGPVLDDCDVSVTHACSGRYGHPAPGLTEHPTQSVDPTGQQSHQRRAP